MKVREIRQNEVIVFELSGRLTEGREMDELADRVNKLIDEGLKKLVFDLNKVYWIDSSGLGLLIRAYTRIQKVEGELKLARVTHSVESLLHMTKLSTVFGVYETVEEAVASF
ncbi:MAG: STAS domain-containing protein [candidate division Zixibacteria bacterium]|nr:STAS domain-containing protein [candidate division Zixibacteria bacterium]